MFAVANLTSVAALGLVAAAIIAWTNTRGTTWGSTSEFLCFLVVGWSYLVAYLGLGCLAISLLRRVSVVTMFAGVLIHVLLVLAGGGIPTSIQLMSLEMRNDPYSYLQITNPIWTLYYILTYGWTPEAAVLAVVIPAAAVCVLLLNLPALVREFRRVRVVLPERVAEDEAKLHPSPELRPKNPWEEQA